MTQRFGMTLIAVAAFALCAMPAETASAWHRNRDCGSDGGSGSWGGNGSNGSNGSWGGSHGSNGSFGGLFSRRRGGSWGSNGSHGSNGGNGSCGSHGGAYNGNHHDDADDDDKHAEDSDKQARSDSQREVRYYGTREHSGGQAQQPAPGAPVINDPAGQPNLNAPQNQALSTPQQPAAIENSTRAAPPNAIIRSGEAAKP